MDSQYPVFKVLRALPHSRAARKVVIYAPSRPLARDGARLHIPSIPRETPGKIFSLNIKKGPLAGPLLVAHPDTEAPPAGATPYPPTVSTAVLSAMRGLTAEFGMGSGGTPSPWSRPRGAVPSRNLYSVVKRTLGAAWRAVARTSQDPIRIAVIGNQMKSSAD